MKKLSIIVPCYNEEESIPYFYDARCKEKENLHVALELIFVNDGSKDKTLDVIKSLTKHKEVKQSSNTLSFILPIAFLCIINIIQLILIKNPIMNNYYIN